MSHRSGRPAIKTDPKTQWLAPGVWAVTQHDGSWGLSNSGLISSARDVLLVDTFFTERRNVRLRELVLELTSTPPTILVNTHHHGDHVNGNGWFPEATVVSHVSTREHVIELDADVSARRFPDVAFGAVRPLPAVLTFATEVQIHLGDLTVNVMSPGIAHCPGNTVAFLPDSKMLFAGDVLLKDCTPGFVGGSATGYLSALTRLRALDVERVVPGHGPICDSSVIDATERYVQWILELADSAMGRGLPPLEAARGADLGEFAGWRDHERLVGNLYRAYAERDPGLSEGVNLRAMWRDTEHYLGRPVRSLA